MDMDRIAAEKVRLAGREGIERRRARREFLARGLRSREETRRTGAYVPAEAVVERLDAMLDRARRASKAGR